MARIAKTPGRGCDIVTPLKRNGDKQMSKVKIKILLTDRLGDLQTEDLADCGFNAGNVVFAHMNEDGSADVESCDFDRATWGSGFIHLDAEEFEVI